MIFVFVCFCFSETVCEGNKDDMIVLIIQFSWSFLVSCLVATAGRPRFHAAAASPLALVSRHSGH